MFNTLNLSSFWKTNLNSEWIPCLIQKHVTGCIWIRCLTQIPILTQNLLSLLGPTGHEFTASPLFSVSLSSIIRTSSSLSLSLSRPLQRALPSLLHAYPHRPQCSLLHSNAPHYFTATAPHYFTPTLQTPYPLLLITSHQRSPSLN